jgi:excisionase family DNA binding protein
VGLLSEERFELREGQTWHDIPTEDGFVVVDAGFEQTLKAYPLTVYLLRFVAEEGTWVFAFYQQFGYGPFKKSLPVPRFFVKLTHMGGDPDLDSNHGRLFSDNDENIFGNYEDVKYHFRPHTIEERELWQHDGAHKESSTPVKSEPQTNTLAEEDWPDMLTIRQAAEYARVTERTIRNWIHRRNGEDNMLSGVIKSGRKISIPRTSLTPWRKPAKATRTPKPTRRKRDTGKRNR